MFEDKTRDLTLALSDCVCSLNSADTGAGGGASDDFLDVSDTMSSIS